MTSKIGMKELVATATLHARKVGITPPTERNVADWIDESLIQSGTPKGNRRGICPTWTYPEEALEAAKKVVELKAQGCVRYSAFRICLATHAHHIPFQYLADDLISELKRSRNSLDRKYPSAFDLRNGGKPPPLEIKRALRQLDRSFKTAGLIMPEETYAGLVSWSKFGDTSADWLQSVGLSDSFTQLLETPLAICQPLLYFGGALGRPDEIAGSGEAILEKVTRQDFESSALSYWSLVYGVSFAEAALLLLGFAPFDPLPQAFTRVRTALSTPQWLVNTIAMGTIGSYRARVARADSSASKAEVK
jgi:hypothetical protein